jgi:outer membrane protein TolC
MKIWSFSILFASATAGLAGAADTVATPMAPTNRVVLTSEYMSLLAQGLRTNHPGVTAAAARTFAAVQNLRGVRTWEDPTVRLGGMGASESKRAEDGDLLYGVEQKLPLFGKPKLARAVAAAEIEVAQANTEYQFQTRRLEFTKHILQAALHDRLVAVDRQDLQWLDIVLSTLESRLAAGQASQLELLKAQNERSKRAERLTSDTNHRYHERLAMNIMLGNPDWLPWPEFELPPVGPVIPHSVQLEALALKFEPKLRMMRQEISRAQAATQLARRQRLPDVMAGVEARNYTGNGSFRQSMMTLSMNLPWLNGAKYRNDISREEAKAVATELEAKDYELTVREEIHKLLVMIDVSRRDAVLFRDEIIPRSRIGLESTRVAWESGRGTLNDVLEGRRMLLEAEAMYAQAVAEQYTAMAQLVLCCGLADLQAVDMINGTNTASPAEKK